MTATFFYIRLIAAVVTDKPDTMQADFVSFEDTREDAIAEAMDHFDHVDLPEAKMSDCVLEVSGPFPLNPDYIAVPHDR